MDSSDAKSSYPSFPISSITFVEDDLKLSSQPPTIVKKDVDLVERRIDETGQERPEDLHSRLQEMGFTFSVAMSQVLTEYFVSGFTVILPGLAQAGIVAESSSIWPASMFSLAVASTALVFGRLADMYGGRRVYISGLIWLAIWSVVIGFAHNEAMLNVSRAFQGIGASAILPSGLMSMGTIYRPGKRKNVVFSIYGACAPLGFFLGILVGGIAGELMPWSYYFWVGATLSLVTVIAAYFTIPKGTRQTQKRSSKSTKLELDEGKNEAVEIDTHNVGFKWTG